MSKSKLILTVFSIICVITIKVLIAINDDTSDSVPEQYIQYHDGFDDGSVLIMSDEALGMANDSDSFDRKMEEHIIERQKYCSLNISLENVRKNLENDKLNLIKLKQENHEEDAQVLIEYEIELKNLETLIHDMASSIEKLDSNLKKERQILNAKLPIELRHRYASLSVFGSNLKPEAQYELANAYLTGIGLDEENYEQALSLYETAAEHGHTGAMVALARIWEKVDMEVAVNWAFKAIENNDAKGYKFLVELYQENQDHPTEYMEWLEKSADAGDPESQLLLGLNYHNLSINSQNDELKDNYMEKSYQWVLKSAENGEPSAQYFLATFIENGFGKENNVASGNSTDLENAIRSYPWYLKAAQNGDSDAQYCLAFIHTNGESFDKDIPMPDYQDQLKGIAWAQRSALQENSKAEMIMGEAYEKGIVLPKNQEKAFKWYLKAAKQDNVLAQKEVAKRYFDGNGVNKDEKKSFEWNLKAAKQGDKEAAILVGNAYIQGRGVDKDEEQGKQWLEKGNSASE